MSLSPSATLARWHGCCGPAGSCSSRWCIRSRRHRSGRWLNDESGTRQARAVGDYFYEGALTETWIFSGAPAELRDRHRPFTITYARRTLAGWLSAVLDAGLVIEAVREPCADEQTAARHPEVADTRIVLCVPKTCATWPDAPLTLAARSLPRCRPGRGMISGLWG